MTDRAVLLDLDGTLVDTAPDLCAVLNTMLARRNRPIFPFAVARNEVSNGALGLIRAALGELDGTEDLETLRAEFIDLYANNVCVNSRLFNGLEDFLSQLEQSACQWGIVTNKPHRLTEALLAALGLAGRPACVVSGDRLPERKPHPAPLILAAHELGVAPTQCVYVGDAPRDIEAGRAARMATIAAAYGYIRPHEDPRLWGADAVIRRPYELFRTCERLRSPRSRMTDA